MEEFMTPTIIQANQECISPWMQMLQRVTDYFPGLENEQYLHELETHIQNHTALAAMVNGVFAGGLLYHKQGDTGEVDFLAVHPDMQGNGVGKALLCACQSKFAKGESLQVITYQKQDPLGHGARGLYLSCGFIEQEELVVFDYPCQKFCYEA